MPKGSHHASHQNTLDSAPRPVDPDPTHLAQTGKPATQRFVQTARHGAVVYPGKGAGQTQSGLPSAGNAGFATAVAAASLGLKACIVVPHTTPETTRARIRKTGAEVIVHGKVWDDANQKAMELAQGARTEYVPAFDHPVLWEGHSSIIDEILEDCPQVDTLVTSVGGGGLLAGILTGLIRHGRMDCRIVACETQGAASFSAALAAGHPVRLPRIDTVATSLGAAQVAAWPVQHIHDFAHQCVVLSDDEAIMGVVRYANDLRQLVEPACGVSLAIGYLDHPAIADARDVVIVVCGGVNISAQKVAGWARLSTVSEK